MLAALIAISALLTTVLGLVQCDAKYGDGSKLSDGCQSALGIGPFLSCFAASLNPFKHVFCTKAKQLCLDAYYDKVESECGSEFMLDAQPTLYRWGEEVFGNQTNPLRYSCIGIQEARFTQDLMYQFGCLPRTNMLSRALFKKTCGHRLIEQKGLAQSCSDKCAWTALEKRCELGQHGMSLAQNVVPIMDYMFGDNGTLYKSIHACPSFNDSWSCNGTWGAPGFTSSRDFRVPARIQPLGIPSTSAEVASNFALTFGLLLLLALK